MRTLGLERWRDDFWARNREETDGWTPYGQDVLT